MSQLRLPLTGLVATILASVCLGTVFNDSTWFLPAAFGALFVVAGCEAARRLRMPPPLVLVVGVAVLVVYVTARYAGDVALLKLLPNHEAWQRIQALSRQGRSDINRYAAPVFPAEGIEMLTVIGVGMVAAMVDTFVVGLRRAALAGLPLLALYTVPATVAPHGVSIPAFVVGAGGYLALLLAESRERVGRWGRSMRYSTTREDWHAPADTSPLAATGRRVGAAVLGIAVLVPLVIPGVSTGLIGGSGNGIGGRGGAGGKNVSTINPIIDLRKDLRQGENKTVLRYKGDAAYLRLVALDDFDGQKWAPTPIAAKKDQKVDKGLPSPPGMGIASSTTKTYKIDIVDLEEQWLPVPYPVSKVTGLGGTWLYDTSTRNVFSTNTSTQKRKYTATVTAVDVQPDQLSSVTGAEAPASIRQKDLALPPDLPVSIQTLAEKETRSATSDYAKAVALQEWFRNPANFTYTTSAPEGNTADAIGAFLDARQGYCVHFASAMALMARTLKIPARVAVGFTPGAPIPGGQHEVRMHDAHAWPELYFEGTGWVAFEPTPATRKGAEPSYTRPQAANGTGQTGQQGGATGQQPDATDPTSNKNRQLAAQDKPNEQNRNPNPALIPTAPTKPFPWVPVTTGVVLLLLLVAPYVTRIAVRRRRFRGLDTPEAAAAAAWAELEDLLDDHGYAWRDSDTPRRGAARLVRDTRISGPGEAGLVQIARVVERVRYAPTPGELPDLRGDLRDVSAGLMEVATTWGKIRARFFPRSTRKVFGIAGGWVADGLDGIDRALAAVRSRILPRRA